MKLPNKANQRRNHFNVAVYELLKKYQNGAVPATDISVGKLDPQLTWVCDEIMKARDESLPPQEKRQLER